MRIVRALPVLALVLGLLVVPAPRAGAGQLSQQPAPGVTAHAGFGDDSSYVMNEWFPVRVLLTNPAGAPSMRVRVEIDSPGLNNKADSSYAREVDLPSPSRKEVTLYVATRAGASFVSSFDLRLAQGDTVIASKSVNARALEPNNDTIIGVLSSDASLFNVLRGERVGHVPALFINPNYFPGPPQSSNPPSGAGARVTVAHLTIDDIPTLSVALNSLSALVLDDMDTSALTQEQLESLTAWIARGGMLIVAARPGGADVSPAIANLLPVQINGTRSLDSLQGLGDFLASPITLPAPVLVTNSTLLTATTDRARLLASQDGVPLAAIRDLGEGHVAYLALSPGLAPLKTWDGLTPLFKRLLVEYKVGSTSSAISAGIGSSNYGYGSSYPTSYSMFSTGGIFNTFGGLFDLPSLELPEPLGVGLFLLVYIVLIGPVNFIVLRRMRRAELAWITIPILVLIFSVGAYLIGYQSKGGDLIMIRANAIHSIPGVQEANARHFTGVFSPLRSNLKMTLNTNSAVAELNPDEYGSNTSNANPVRVATNGSNSTTLDNVIINTGSIRSFVAEDIIKTDAPLEANLHLADNLIVGTLRNRTNSGLQDVALVRGDAVQYIGYIGAGSAAQVKLAVSTRAFDNGSPASILPPPSGVSANNGSGGGPGSYSNGSTSSGQRQYNRRVQLLNIALTPLLSNGPPTDLDVLAVAWGAHSPVSVNVEGHIARTEDLSVWTSRLPVAAGADQLPRLKAGSVPFWIYLPTTDPAWYSQLPSSGVTLDPYADMHFQLPPGTKPEHLSLVIPWALPEGVDLLAYNVQTGQWDSLVDTSYDRSHLIDLLSLPNPKDHTGPAGDVTIRLLSRSGKKNMDIQTFEMALN